MHKQTEQIEEFYQSATYFSNPYISKMANFSSTYFLWLRSTAQSQCSQIFDTGCHIRGQRNGKYSKNCGEQDVKYP